MEEPYRSHLSNFVSGSSPSEKDVTAIQALQLGIVDNVVSLEELDQVALEVAQSYARLPSGYSVGIKKLLNFDIRGLKHYLAFEDDLLRKRISFVNRTKGIKQNQKQKSL